MTKLPSVDVHVASWRDDWGRIWRFVGWTLLVLGALGVFGSQLPPPPDAPPRAANAQENGLAGSLMIVGLAGWALWRRTLTIDRHARELRIRRGVGPLGWTNTQPLAGIEHVSISRHERRGGSRSRRGIEYRVKATGAGKAIRLASFYESGLFASPVQANAFANEVAAFTDWKRDMSPGDAMADLDKLETPR